MSRTIDADAFVLKNNLMAKGYEQDERKQKNDIPDKQKENSCYNCRRKQKCAEFVKLSTGGLAGSVSIGADTKFHCDRHQLFQTNKAAEKKASVNVKALMKTIKKSW